MCILYSPTLSNQTSNDGGRKELLRCGRRKGRQYAQCVIDIHICYHQTRINSKTIGNGHFTSHNMPPHALYCSVSNFIQWRLHEWYINPYTFHTIIYLYNIRTSLDTSIHGWIHMGTVELSMRMGRNRQSRHRLNSDRSVCVFTNDILIQSKYILCTRNIV